MKKIFCLMFILFGTFAVIAQERIITETEFKAASVESFRRLEFPHRRTDTSIKGINGSNRIITKAVFEFGGNGNSRWNSEFNSPTLKRKSETVRVNNVIYKRENGGEWQVINAPLQNIEGEPRFDTKTPEKFIEKEKVVIYKYLGTEELEGKNVDVYSVMETTTLVKADTDQELNSVQTTKYLFGKDVFFRKEESERKLVVKTVRAGFPPIITDSQTSRTTDWQIDPSIKIEAPVK